MKIFLAFVLLIAACSQNTGTISQEGRHPDAKVFHDAKAFHDAPPADADLAPDPGYVNCWYPNAPSTMCPLATQFCCFWNNMSPVTGGCTSLPTSNCVHSVETCDGPEDCASGQSCFGHYDNVTFFVWTMACSTTAPDPANDITMCRVGGGTCPTGTTCMSPAAAGVAGVMPTQYVCH